MGVTGIEYLGDVPWDRWTRDERYFCSVVHELARDQAAEFAAWISNTCGLGLAATGTWDLGYEVCFYRDYCWHVPGPTAKARGLSTKRTFDLCLFGEADIVVIEAKVCEGFGSSQNEDFAKDAGAIAALLGPNPPVVHMVALASSTYFDNLVRHGRRHDDELRALKPFQGQLTWAHLADYFGEARLAQADWLYGRGPGDSLAPV